MVASELQSYSPVLRLGPATGRDFVVGDIHGMFHLLLQALDELQFDPSRDRLFPVGDLVDRGPFSREARSFLREPWVKALRGNHEQLFLDCYQGGQLDAAALDFHVRRNGAGWWMELSSQLQQELLEEFAKLPLAIEVQTERGTVGLVHAEVPRGMGWQEFTQRLEAGDHHTVQSCLWGRTRVKSGDASGVRGVDRVFSGHTILGQVSRLGNCYFLDTGAFQRGTGQDKGSLAVANLIAATAPIMERRKTAAIVQLFEKVRQGPFGDYLGTWGP